MMPCCHSCLWQHIWRDPNSLWWQVLLHPLCLWKNKEIEEQWPAWAQQRWAESVASFVLGYASKFLDMPSKQLLPPAFHTDLPRRSRWLIWIFMCLSLMIIEPMNIPWTSAQLIFLACQLFSLDGWWRQFYIIDKANMWGGCQSILKSELARFLPAFHLHYWAVLLAICF